jgi:hypothetical protein
MRKWIVGAAVVAAGLGAGAVRAVPPETLTFNCQRLGTIQVEVKGGSRVASTVEGDRYKAVVFEVHDGNFNFIKVYGSAKDLNNPDIDTCVSPDGVVTIQVIPA